MRNHSNENEFDLHENGHVGETHFHMNGFAPRLVLKQRQRPGGVLGPIFVGYVPLLSQNPCPIIVIFYGQL